MRFSAPHRQLPSCRARSFLGSAGTAALAAVVAMGTRVACCDHVNRGAVYANGRLFYATLDNQAVAVDAETGEEVWKVLIGNIHIGESMTRSPLVVRDLVFFGNSAGEFGVRGWPKALEIYTGATVWTAYSTGADTEVLIGPTPSDHQWIYGGRDVDAFESIYFGRPDGMPACGAHLPADQIRMPVAYVESFEYDRSLSVRREEPEFEEETEEILERRQADIQAILDEYGVPQVRGGRGRSAP